MERTLNTTIRNSVTKILPIVTAAALLGHAGTVNARVMVAVPSAQPTVEVVFVLDTTGSMSGLIDGAKRRIWGIANHIVSGKPTPNVRIGLVGYRDIGDDYVVKHHPLHSDLDAVYASLSRFHAAGGGDFPEHVNRALHEAVYTTQWSKNSMKMIFLVGDAPPHTDYQDGFDYHKIAKHAASQNIVIHTIRCGGNAATAQFWQQIAAASNGSFTSIQQSGGVVAVATPYDDRLATLSRDLNQTAVIYGNRKDHDRVAKKYRAQKSAPAAPLADRSSYYAKSGAKLDRADIVSEVASGSLGVDKLETNRLPAAMRKMSKSQRKTYLKKQHAKRKKLLKEIQALTKKRDAYLRSQAKRTKGGFDQVVQSAITEQAKRHKLRY